MAVLDTLKASRRLRDAGIEEAHAEALVGAFTEDIGANLATKDDIALLRSDVVALGDALRSEMALHEQRMNLRIALAIGSATTVLLAAIAIATGILATRL